MNRIEEGRSLLRRWEESKPTNFYEDDQHLRRVLAFRVDAARLAPVAPLLHQAGADAAGPVSRASALLDRPEHLPRLEPWNGIGERTEEIVFHPAYHEVGRLVWRSRVLSLLGEPGNVALHTALAYLFAQNGEVPHLCPVACTSGLVKAIQRCGSDWMRREWLPRLLDADYDRRWHGAQFLTEVQGGSDVGANACVARPIRETPGAWRISGEKWFCSNVHADLYAVSARPEGAPEGTKGIGLFVIPRRLDNGSPNGVFIRRLKQKLGTRTLPTAEVDFQDALGYQLGSLEEGFRVMMGVIINTSRLGVALGSCGIMRRAWVEALHYARARGLRPPPHRVSGRAGAARGDARPERRRPLVHPLPRGARGPADARGNASGRRPALPYRGQRQQVHLLGGRGAGRPPRDRDPGRQRHHRGLQPAAPPLPRDARRGELGRAAQHDDGPDPPRRPQVQDARRAAGTGRGHPARRQAPGPGGGAGGGHIGAPGRAREAPPPAAPGPGGGGPRRPAPGPPHGPNLPGVAPPGGGRPGPDGESADAASRDRPVFRESLRGARL
ncbi:MAG: acyl-CoA dehydrogenase family protein [Candidatus Rokubacteria bacterium]|nr:acyl-CoA dehydrogenase family protein [Candidatus Rokubacteria bacterium]